jgi:hypothetical protein
MIIPSSVQSYVSFYVSLVNLWLYITEYYLATRWSFTDIAWTPGVPRRWRARATLGHPQLWRPFMSSSGQRTRLTTLSPRMTKPCPLTASAKTPSLSLSTTTSTWTTAPTKPRVQFGFKTKTIHASISLHRSTTSVLNFRACLLYFRD